MNENGASHPRRRAVLKAAGALLALGVTAKVSWSLAKRQGREGGGPPAIRGTQLILLGTQGGPTLNGKRGETASVVVVDGRPHLVDCGYGTLRALVASGVGYTQVGTIFFTHLHDDHTADLPALLTHQWTGSRTEPTEVYGPHGTTAMVEAAVAFYRANTEIRMVDEGRPTKPDGLVRGHDLAAAATPTEVVKTDFVRVTQVENAHYPARSTSQMPHRSLAYRVETAHRTIVFSGDTAYSKNVVELAKDADFFVCEAMDVEMFETMEARAKEDAKSGKTVSVARHIVETHSTTVDVGRMAAEAKVKAVVLNHLLPGSSVQGPSEFPDTAYIEGVRKNYGGQVIVGRDLMVL